MVCFYKDKTMTVVRFFAWSFRLSGGLSDGLSEGLNLLLATIKEHPGIQTNKLSVIIDRPVKTLERQIKTLAEKKLIERHGSKKTGGYRFIEAKEKLNGK